MTNQTIGPDAGPGVPVELRDAVISAIYTYPAGDFTPGDAEAIAGMVFRAIATSGCAIVATDRLKRLQEAAYGIHGYLQPGDLEPVGPGGEAAR